ncbi:MAG: M48 family metalloprotease, partial [Actinomycetota bacterium]|nr:M48 family metalloprotease [Actinomycetota bacterium]
WLALGITLFVPAIQAAVLSPVLGVRRPRPDEIARIAPVWDRLIADVGKGGHRFTYRIVDSDELNAYACGGHLVVVTSFAVEELPPSELAGVLAHELSHHLGLHTVALTVGHWLSLPIVALARIGFFLQNVARAATESFVQHSAALTTLGRVIAGLLTGISWVFLAVLHASDAVGNLVGHQAEYEADRRAIDLGHGPELAAALRRLIRLGGGQRAIGFRARLGASHPAARTRVARIEALLRHPTMR